MTQIDWKCHQEGFRASEENDSDPRKAQNPYPPESIEWRSWNRGWNEQGET